MLGAGGSRSFAVRQRAGYCRELARRRCQDFASFQNFGLFRLSRDAFNFYEPPRLLAVKGRA